MATLTHVNEMPAFEDICLAPDKFEVRKISVNDLWSALREGYADFGAKPSSIPLLILFYLLFALLFSLFALGEDLRYLVFPIVAGFTFIGPMVAIVFFEISRRRERGQPLLWTASLRFIHTHSFAPILALSIVMGLLYIAWLFMAEFIYFNLFGDSTFVTMSAFINELFSTRHGAALIFYGNVVGFLFAFAAMALSVIAFPLALDQPVTSVTAIKVSVQAFTSNFYVLAVWGVIVVALLTIGAAFFLVGLSFTLPVLGHATWHLYKKIVA